MNLKITFLSFLLLCFNLKLIAQLPSPDLASEPSIQSPNASAMGRFGEIPVSLFTGTPLINIPITTIKAGDIAVPISLLYDTQGCRPDQHPTWVGLNWSLQAGGVIRRHTNGRFDENVNSRVVNTKNYYDNHTDLAANDWDNLVHSLKSWEDLSPDEFSFSFNGISGSFILNHEGKWVVKSKGNLSLKVQHEIHEDYDAPLILQPIPRTFTKFILTTGDGTRYIFGGQQNAIEFSVPGLPQHVEPKNLPPGFSGPPIVNNALWIEHVQSSAWHLSEIISPYGQSIKFYYTVGGIARRNRWVGRDDDIGNRDNPLFWPFRIECQHPKQYDQLQHTDNQPYPQRLHL